jgi:hypothetical protein
MRVAGLKDGEILEVNQVAAYFAYANRTVTGLGVSTEGEKLGLSPENNEHWEHLEKHPIRMSRPQRPPEY